MMITIKLALFVTGIFLGVKIDEDITERYAQYKAKKVRARATQSQADISAR